MIATFEGEENVKEFGFLTFSIWKRRRDTNVVGIGKWEEMRFKFGGWLLWIQNIKKYICIIQILQTYVIIGN